MGCSSWFLGFLWSLYLFWRGTGGFGLLKFGFLIWGSPCSLLKGLVSIVNLSINFSMVFNIISNLTSAEEDEVEGKFSYFLLLSKSLCFIFPLAIMLASTSRESWQQELLISSPVMRTQNHYQRPLHNVV